MYRSENGSAHPRADSNERALDAGFEQLRSELAAGGNSRAAGDGHDFDLVIVGSGYGGAIAAQAFSGCNVAGHPARVCVLERGRRYQPADFPDEAAMLPGHIRFDTSSGKAVRGERDGLFDLRIGPDVCTLLANGLGGGSLINAGVMLEPSDAVLESPDWPAAMGNGAQLRSFLRRARALLDGPAQSNPWNDDRLSSNGDLVPADDALPPDAGALPPAGAALRRLAQTFTQGRFSAPPLSIALDGDQCTDAGVALKRCLHCGDCMTGCRHGAKRSLDTSLLAGAVRRGARVFTGATVLRLSRCTTGAGWLLDVVHTDQKLRKRQGKPLVLSARRVVLAAGTLGSTEILMRSSAPDLCFSDRLGERFSTNGDMIATLWGLPWSAEQGPPPSRPGIGAGPTISAMLDLRPGQADGGTRATQAESSATSRHAGIVVQTLVVPSALRRLYEETVTTAHALNTLDRADQDPHGPDDRIDPCAVDAEAVDRTLAVAMMGDDGANGRLALRAGNEGDSAIDVHWSDLRRHRLFQEQIALLEDLLAGSEAPDATVLPNPIWSPMHEGSASVFNVGKGPLLTVHPLGGCRMGNCRVDGVVNDVGQVFDRSGPQDDSIHDGLAILDGAIVPRALGINPALTIAALALRACEALRSKWGFEDAGALPLAGHFARALADVGAPGEHESTERGPAETRIELRERMSGVLRLASLDGRVRRYRVELTLSAGGATLRELADPMGRTLAIRPQPQPFAPGGLLRVFAIEDWERIEHPRHAADLGRGDTDIEARLEAAALLSVPVAGSIRLLERETSTAAQRRRRALCAWARNRGVRDGWQYLVDLLRRPGAGTGPGLFRRVALARRIATRAGEARSIRYQLELGAARKLTALSEAPDPAPFGSPGAMISGIKLLSYTRRCNPWRQLSQLEITTFPALATGNRRAGERPVLTLDTAYLARVQTPLLRIIAQRDQPGALIDLVSMALYWFRLLLSVHLWSFRAPDAPPPGEPQRLPGTIPGLPRPSIHWIPLGRTPDGAPIAVRLTRYPPVGLREFPPTALRSGQPPAKLQPPPVVLIHGYSTSGTCFAHPQVDPNLASWLWQRGRDVWVVDLRTSSGLPTATLPWRFEDAALVDLPEAFSYIREQVSRERGTGQKLDVVAHCMGAVMFSMAVLRPPPGPHVTPAEPDAPACDSRLAEMRRELPGWIRRAVLSQAGPVLAFERGNVFRAYAMRWLRHFLPLTGYRFRVDAPGSQLDGLIDRALATLPYPEHEFDGENPRWRSARFVATRHRMDALYGRDFELANMAPQVLDRIDDLFGPLSIETVSQTLHFARHRTITDRAGRGAYASAANIAQRWTFPTLYLHSARSGLFDRTTAALLEARFAAGGAAFVTESLDELGHQDSLIGRKAGLMFARISAWLDARREPTAGHGFTHRLWVRAPAFGPVICAAPSRPRDELRIRFGTEPAFGPPERLVLVPVTTHGGLHRHGALVPLDFESRGDDWWETTLPLGPLRKQVAAVLVLIVRGHPAWAVDPVAALPDSGEIRQAIEKAVDAELFDSGSELESGLLRLGDHPNRDRRPKGFLLASCQYPAGMIDGHVAEASLRRMHALLDASADAPLPDGLLLLGDMIYADATAGLFDPARVDERLSARYRTLLSMPPFRAILRRLRVLAMPDDHEIFDNWEPTGPTAPAGAVDDSEAAKALAESRTAFLTVFGGAERDRSGDSRLWFTTRMDGHPLFMMDTRTMREHRDPATIGNATIVDEHQACALEDWLLRGAAHHGPRFIASPSMLLPRRRLPAGSGPAGALRFDAWDGYPRSLHRLLAFIAKHRLQRLVFVSGDEHLSCVARIELMSDSGETLATLLSVHSSALYAPWPFANSRHTDFLISEEFEIAQQAGCGAAAARLWCRVVATDFAPVGSGFARITAHGHSGAWMLDCDFFDGANEGSDCFRLRYALDRAPTDAVETRASAGA